MPGVERLYLGCSATLWRAFGSLSHVLRGEGWGEGPDFERIWQAAMLVVRPLTPALSPAYRGEGAGVATNKSYTRAFQIAGAAVHGH